MTGSSEQQKAARNLYCSLMFEARHRIDFTLRLCDNIYALPDQPKCELGYLQLRMISETVALACLVVFGEVPGSRSAIMRSAFEADKILKRLGQLHPNFYPQPGLPTEHPDGGRAFIPSTADYMTKEQLITLYAECGDQLHRGKYDDAAKFPKLSFDSIRPTAQKFVELLRFHKISFLGSEDEMWVQLVDPVTTRVSATLERPIDRH